MHAITELLEVLPHVQSVPRNFTRTEATELVLKARMFSTMLSVRYVHLAKAQHIHKRQIRPLVKEDATKGL
jgi:hypothetical protein